MPERVLIVDDDPGVLRMLVRTLAADGYDTIAAPDGGAALAAAERSVPDLVVLDVAMPGLDGLEVSRRLRAKGIGVPVLMLTPALPAVTASTRPPESTACSRSSRSSSRRRSRSPACRAARSGRCVPTGATVRS
jgi:CheY-like chemotaxis protein